MINIRLPKKQEAVKEEKAYKTVYCLYRVSTAGQVDHDDIPMQREACQEFASRQNGWVIKKELYEKGVSGYKISANDRDAIQELMGAAQRKEFDILLVFMFDRLGRRQNETSAIVETFSNLGVEVWSTKEGQQRFENEADYLLNDMRFWAANGESRKTSMRVKTRLAQLVEQGVYTGGTTPFGYKLIRSGEYNKKGKELMKLEIDPAEANIVKIIFNKTVIEGYGSHVMAEYINSMKVRTHKGSEFQSNTINRILRNPIYCGYFVRGGTISPKVEELVIIDEDTYNEAQRILDGRAIKTEHEESVAKFSKSEALVSGTLYCGHCESKMNATSHCDSYKTKDGVRHPGKRKLRYICAGKAMKRNDCDGQCAYLGGRIDSVVRKQIEDAFKEILTTPRDVSIDRQVKAHLTGLKKEVKDLEKELTNAKKKYSDLTEEIANALCGESKFDSDTLAIAIEKCKNKIADTAKELAEKKATLDEQKVEYQNIDKYYDQFVTWAEEFNNSSISRQRMIVNALIDRIYVFKGYQVIVVIKSTYNQFLADQADTVKEVS